jgi:hypothetical protein
MDVDRSLEVLRALEREGVRYAVFGAVALNLHGLARATRDLDLFVAPDPANVARLRAALHSVFADPSIDEITADDLGGEYPAIAYVPPEGDFAIDIVARLGEAFAFADVETERVTWEGLGVTVATPAMLYRMKRDTIRPQDRADAARLRQHFSLEED